MNKKIEGSTGANISAKESDSFMAMTQDQFLSGLTEVFAVHTNKFGILMCIGSEEGVTYITREQAKAFFGFVG